jgi:hypothetical protein
VQWQASCAFINRHNYVQSLPVLLVRLQQQQQRSIVHDIHAPILQVAFKRSVLPATVKFQTPTLLPAININHIINMTLSIGIDQMMQHLEANYQQ